MEEGGVVRGDSSTWELCEEATKGDIAKPVCTEVEAAIGLACTEMECCSALASTALQEVSGTACTPTHTRVAMGATISDSDIIQEKK